MTDPYLYDDIAVLRNRLDIKDEKILDLIEAEQSRANMMLLYERGFDDFSAEGLCSIHQFLFGDIYDWAGQFRIINIEKREKLLGGRSVWYSNDDMISEELNAAFHSIQTIPWNTLSKNAFVEALAKWFSKIWQIHPFREGNTRAVVMMLTFFVEFNGHYMDQELLASAAGYVRDAFVMASLGKYAEYEHLETILLDAVCERPVQYTLSDDPVVVAEIEKYKKYQKETYTPEPHYRREVTK